ncbi:MAG: aspartate aminotransferase family protein [Desulfurococcales archaeon]|nr:aspartate aminotransferase family protein [Desulfurococcales archaeon]
MSLPESKRDPKLVLDMLSRIAAHDLDPWSGRMFGHVYDTGLKELREAARKAFEMFQDKTMLDFTVYPSVLELERQVVRMSASLVNGGDEVVGAFTYGGTESIMLAVKAARDYFKSRGGGGTPTMILPVTGHPAFVKAAEYLGLRVARAPVDGESYRVDVEAVKEMVSGDTAIIVASAPNYPMGVIDDIEALSDIAVDKGVWLHVDACIGGFLLPFLRDAGDNVPPFGFELPGVASLSMDLHKYGYAPRGASVVLYRGEDRRLRHIFVNASWPGYPIVNMAVLSTRSAGPLAASWLVLNSLGYEGYLDLARKVLAAREAIKRGVADLGFNVLGDPHGGILAFSTGEISPTRLAAVMARRKWYIQVQPGSKPLGLPRSIHLTISPVHHGIVDEFIKDLASAKEEATGLDMPSEEELDQLATIIESSEPEEVLSILGLGEGGGSLDESILALVDELIYRLSPSTVETLLRLAVSRLFK